MDKCDWSKEEVKFLGDIILDKGVQLDPTKTEAVKEMAEPSNVSELQSFLGLVNQLGKFIPQYQTRTNLSETYSQRKKS